MADLPEMEFMCVLLKVKQTPSSIREVEKFSEEHS